VTLTDDEVRLIRSWIGERIPEGGSEADTRFTDQQIREMAEPFSYLEEVAAEGYRLKAGWVIEDTGGVVEKSVGSERLKLTDPAKIRDYYLEMADYYQSLVPIDPSSTEGSMLFAQEGPDVLGTRKLLCGTDISRLIGVDCE
jgi:hypothetical protein